MTEGTKSLLSAQDRPRLLDLFCGAGGAAMGYHRAGFEVVGVDKKPQPRYPFEFIHADVMSVTIRDDGWWVFVDAGPKIGGSHHHRRGFAAIHASPPCQRFSSATAVSGGRSGHPDVIAPTRELLRSSGLPYVIENVPRAPLLDPALVCGAERGLGINGFVLRRHRLFETNWPLATGGCGCRMGDGESIGVYGGGSRVIPRLDGGGGDTRKANLAEARVLFDMPWANRTEISQSIPPAYTELIGGQLIAHLGAAAA